MKTLQNDLTTIEQSNRLLELGVPKNSANHYYGKDGKLHYIDGTIPYSLLWETECTPCWSVGRLIKILKVCVTNRNELNEIFDELKMCIDETAVLVQTFKEYSDVIDFSKLEK